MARVDRLAAGMNGFVSKPIDAESFLAIVAGFVATEATDAMGPRQTDSRVNRSQ
jgi:CheY-like chemotaxis protein